MLMQELTAYNIARHRAGIMLRSVHRCPLLKAHTIVVRAVKAARITERCYASHESDLLSKLVQAQRRPRCGE